jgi:hypothetical protein
MPLDGAPSRRLACNQWDYLLQEARNGIFVTERPAGVGRVHRPAKFSGHVVCETRIGLGRPGIFPTYLEVPRVAECPLVPVEWVDTGRKQRPPDNHFIAADI